MSSAVARPIRSSSKKLTSSKMFLLSELNSVESFLVGWSGGLDLFDAAGLTPGQVDAELFGCPEDVFVGLANLDGHAVARQHLDVEAERLHLLDQHLERLGDAWLGDVLALDDGFVDLDAAKHVVRSEERRVGEEG